MLASNQALQHISYPTQVMLNTVKPVLKGTSGNVKYSQACLKGHLR